ncbi:MAG: hypothetical protein ACTSQY_10325 [Candidatus Odinarchaeia archaeon]
MKVQEESGRRRSATFSDDAYSFFLSFEGELVTLLENYTPGELDFLKKIVVERDAMNKIVESNLDKIRSSMTISEYQNFLDPVMKEWGFSSICGGLSLKETMYSFMMSNALKSSLIADPFHNDVLHYTMNYIKQKIEKEKRPEILSEIIPLHLKDYSNLTIDKIIDLRNDSSIVAFRETVNELVKKAPEVEDWKSEIAGTWYREFLKDMAELAPPSRRSCYFNAFIDLITTTPVLEPRIAILQLLFGGAKLVYDSFSEYDKIQAYHKSLTHFCLRLSEVTSE